MKTAEVIKGRAHNQNHLLNTFNIADNNYYTEPKTQVIQKNNNKNNINYFKTEVIKKPESNGGYKNFNFFNKKTQISNTPKNINNTIILNNKIEVKQYNGLFNNYDRHHILNAHQETNIEKNLIPNPKAKIKGYRNPFISQIKIK